MLVTIRLFARLRELVGSGEMQRELPEGATTRTAWETLTAEVPGIAAHSSSVSCAVNEDYAKWTTALKDGDEVAFLPPVSGGTSSGVRGARSEVRGPGSR